jgi:hypothetical protein
VGVPERAYQRGFDVELDEQTEKRSKASSTGDEHGTPDFVLEAVTKTLGPIGLDPCGHPKSLVEARRKIRLPKYWDEDGANSIDLVNRNFEFGDGEMTEWGGNGLVFCNGPFSELHWWCWKSAELNIYNDAGKPTGDESVLLLPVRTTHSAWQKAIFGLHHAIIFAAHRWKFHLAPTTAPFHTALAYRGYRPAKFVEGFKHLGMPVRHMKQGDLFYCPF